MDQKASIPSAKQEPSAIHLFSQSIHSISIHTYRFHPFKSLNEPIGMDMCVYGANMVLQHMGEMKMKMKNKENEKIYKK